MPVLHEYKHRDGYYVTAFVHGANGIVTYQLKVEGVQLLEHYGIEAGDTFDNSLLAELRELSYAYTRGGGLSASATLGISNQPEWDLAFEETGGDISWQLSVVVPEIPKEWIEGESLGRTVAQLSRCYLGVQGGGQIPAVHLLPGKGKALCHALPQETEYEVQVTGPWPSEWPYSEWQRPVRGLDPVVTLFAGEEQGGVRLRRGTQLILGERYYLTLKAKSTGSLGSQTVPRFPSEVGQRYLGQIQSWEAWEVVLPAKVTPALRWWCVQLGYSVQEPGWRLSLLSPPPTRYTEMGLPVVAVGDPVIVAVYTPENSSISDRSEASIKCNGVEIGRVKLADIASFFHWTSSREESEGRAVRYFTIPTEAVGTYEIIAQAGRVTPLKFVAEEENEDSGGLGPQPVRAVIGAGATMWEITAFEAGAERLNRITVVPGEDLSVEVKCAVPVALMWEGPRSKEKRTTVMLTSEEGEGLLKRAIAESLGSKGRRILEIDAGNYGRLRLLFEAQVDVIREVLPKTMLGRARWLAAWADALQERTGIPQVVVPTSVRTALIGLERIPSAVALASRPTVPAAVLPYLYGLVKAITGKGKRDR